jgi:hypothetical protein
MQPNMSQATPAQLQAMQNMQARLQHSMQQQQQAQAGGSGQPPGMRPPLGPGFGLSAPGAAGMAGGPAVATAAIGALGSPAGLPRQQRPPPPSLAPGQMMAGGLPGGQVGS